MSFGYDLKKNFTSQVETTLNAPYYAKEVDLFRCLIDAFSSMSNYMVAEIHGNRHQVEYSETKGWFLRAPRCELGDIIIIAFSRVRCQGRLVIIQNKVSRRFGQLSSNHRDVYANLVQYELMCNRPIFSPANGPYKGKENTLINRLPYPSVCQYGLFYKDPCGGIDMSSITAQEFTFAPSTAKKFPLNSKSPCAKIILPSDFSFETFNSRNSKKDFVGAKTLVDFGDLLEDLYIGMPISPNLKDNILQNLNEKRNDAYSTSTMRRLIDDFSTINFSESIDRENDISASQGSEMPNNIIDMCRALLLINLDVITPEFVEDTLTDSI